jgi:hypothetical protein
MDRPRTPTLVEQIVDAKKGKIVSATILRACLSVLIYPALVLGPAITSFHFS